MLKNYREICFLCTPGKVYDKMVAEYIKMFEEHFDGEEEKINLAQRMGV